MSADSHEKHNPLDQFKVEKIIDLNFGSIDISFTNSALYMVIATALAIIFMLFATRKKAMVPSKPQVVAESIYNLILGMVKGSIGNEGSKFFPLVFTLFCFIIASNSIGLTPYSFTATSQLIVTFCLAMISFTVVTGFAIKRNGFIGFLKMLLPSGVPLPLAPLLFVIEFISYLIRPVTLSVRLFANMVAGHVLLKIIAGFILSLGIIFGTVPFAFSVVIIGFEFFVAAIQAYVFSILVCSYFGDVVKEH